MEIRNSSIQINIARSGSPLSQIAEQTMTGLTTGSYEVFIFDWERDGSVASMPLYMANVNVTEHAIFTTSFPQTTTTGRLCDLTITFSVYVLEYTNL